MSVLFPSGPVGAMVIGGESVVGTGEEIRSADPRTGAALDPGYPAASAGHLERACALAEQAFPVFRATTAEQRAGFLERIADLLEERRDLLVERAHTETALPAARLTGEVGRTSGQLRLFAAELRAGTWQGARIDPAQPSRGPLPRADIRQRRIPLGPVAVFGASNFPLAFSTAGGDTASALAAGCPVVVKAHQAHLGTAELVARTIAAAAADTGMPQGVFSQLVGNGTEVGARLVGDRRIRAVGFTGSRKGGLAIAATAAARPVPIPVYAEMSSINPVLLLPAALASRGAELGAAFAGSLTLGAGQFCTNPGLVLAVEGPGLAAFISAAADAVAADAGATMLTMDIAGHYAAAGDALAARDGVDELARGGRPGSSACGRARLLTVDGARFAADPRLQAEVFGATSLLVRCADTSELTAAVETLEGQLTATVHADEADHSLAAELLPLLEERAGRILFDGWPTGVEVGHAMVHGGPFPATTDPRSTSVGTLAIERFLRPVAYQDVPTALLPAEVRDENPLGVWRRLDGEPSRDALAVDSAD
ncbi:aldehyde dehydrogenase (NADP(+)) [Streptomyces rapamycinicus]|uniref:2,5-dioxovalerate dehydrogenase n=2 Tax=Streptomyces rapamycinicus TaxID=1226757 RepID=A0A0A0NS95_STRRN|nr:aldehyde dehydrogenase (NADP(+)) [Streptomyces rapamycinicus]AGP59228.1 2,5-dioxovalerate dehydrogenase [Streptomyces rapamycinicus NRRL 5491]MBB4786973.1 NADP-dependent aldehyde dehydrogenase [Streptomyces rapamycinicus]RLV77575.1 2,5-dioxovalerate dehydrogenase [Streptomyces rapamycinicus NRRL 5491]UTO66984.1 aldehyde dehydrogenase (NADP(+)) [Streptomyces rapamycinicus]UTP34941.1 aldehyde dehydrogenase (NADP(+)) [Streptomyces rapamycinicus NRRL 5491]